MNFAWLKEKLSTDWFNLKIKMNTQFIMNEFNYSKTKKKQNEQDSL